MADRFEIRQSCSIIAGEFVLGIHIIEHISLVKSLFFQNSKWPVKIVSRMLLGPTSVPKQLNAMQLMDQGRINGPL